MIFIKNCMIRMTPYDEKIIKWFESLNLDQITALCEKYYNTRDLRIIKDYSVTKMYQGEVESNEK